MTGDGFALDPRLAADSVFLADGPLSQLRLMDDARFPWLVLVPRLPGAEEWLDLDFNYAYHPSGVHSNRWSCPLAPASNVLGLAVALPAHYPNDFDTLGHLGLIYLATASALL